MKIDLDDKTNVLTYHKKLLAEAQKEKDDLKTKVEKCHNSSKNLGKLLNSQMSAYDKFGLGYRDHRYNGILSYENEVLQSVFKGKESDFKNTPLNDRLVKICEMHAVPPPMTGNYMPSGPDIEVYYSQFTYEPSELVSELVVNESNVECQPKVWSDAPIIEEYESDSEDEYVSIPTKEHETPSFANQQVKTPRENVKNQSTHSQKPKVNQKELGYGFTVRACFVCGSLNHLIKDCDFHEKRMARKAELNNGWNNVQRVNKQNQFVPTAVLTRTGKIPVSTARASSTKIFSTARQSFNRQTVLTSTAMKVNTFKPNVNRVRPANVFHKTHSRPFKKTTVLRTDFSKQKVNTAKDYPHRALKNKGIVDSGCSRHMTGNKAYLAEFQDFNGGPVAFGGSKGYITGKGKIKTGKLDFEDVCFVKELQHFNLFSVSQMCDKKNKVLFTDSECLVLSPEFKLPDENQVLLKVPRQNNMYSFNLENIVPSGGLACLIAKATTDESNKWHRRLGHVNFKNLNRLVKGNLVRGLPTKLFLNDHTCVACQKGKQHKASCKAKLVSSISHTLQLLHMDLFGPTSVRSINHKTYCLVITDDFSRFSWTFFLRTKDETSAILKDFIRQIENQLNQKVKTIRCDNGTEFKNRDVIEFCGLKGIKREYSNARTPQQNGVAERKNRTLIEAARTMLADLFLPNTFWAEAVSTACYVLNRVLVTKPHNKTPYELLTGKTPIISYIRPFGCHVTILNTIDHLGKFAGKSDEGFLVGSENQANLHAGQQESNQNTGTKDKIDAGDSEKEDESDQDCFELPIWHSYSSTNSSASKSDNKRGGPREEEQVFLDDLARLQRQEKEANEEAEALRKNLEQETENLVTQAGAAKSSSTNIFSTVRHNSIKLAEADFTNLETVVNVSPIPTSRINPSHPSLTYNRRSNNMHPLSVQVGSYQNRKDERGDGCQNKAWIGCSGLKQEEGIDYDEVLLPCFLYGKIDEEDIWSQPPGFLDPKYPEIVSQSGQALYGLHQAPEACSSLCDDIILGLQEVLVVDDFEALMKCRFQDEFKGRAHFLSWHSSQTETSYTNWDSEAFSLKNEEANAVLVLGFSSPTRPLLSAVKSIFRSDYAGANLEGNPKNRRLSFLGRWTHYLAMKKANHCGHFYYRSEYVAAASCCGQESSISFEDKAYCYKASLIRVCALRRNSHSLVGSSVDERGKTHHGKSNLFQETPKPLCSTFLPTDVKHCLNVGYTFVNFATSEAVWKSHVCITRKSWPLFKSKKIAQVVRAWIKSKNSLVKHFEDMRLYRPSKEYLQVWFDPPRDVSMSCLTTKGMRTIRAVCASIPDTYIVHSLFGQSRQLANISVPLDHFPVNSLTSKVFSFMIKKGKHFSGKVTPLFDTMLVQPTQDEGASSERLSVEQPSPSPAPTGEVPNESLPDSSSAQPSEVPFEQQPGPSPRPSPTPSPTPIVPDSIPEPTGENLGDHSSNDTSLSGNEDDMTLQNVYDLCISLCQQVSDQAKEIKLLKAKITKLKKQAKPVIKHHKAYLKSLSLQQRFPRKSFSKKHRVHKKSVFHKGGRKQ
ncbi:putative ribonuclease H-like domain-containing protein [Tanacetum coccineum]